MTSREQQRIRQGKYMKKKILILVIILILLTSYIVYRIPIKISGSYNVYCDDGETEVIEIRLLWKRYLLSPDEISGSLQFRDYEYVSLDQFAKTHRISFNSQAGLSINSITDKLKGVIIAYPFTSASDFDDWFTGINKIELAPPYQNLRQGKLMFFFTDEIGNISLFESLHCETQDK
jgi:hypothetical protein